VVLVVGETARAANWGLSGYARQTTPQLATLPVINFAAVTACGTNTETSLPCMFAPGGPARLRRSAHPRQRVAAARAGPRRRGVHWRDNQSGCKGVCEGLPRRTRWKDLGPPGLCRTAAAWTKACCTAWTPGARWARPAGTQLLVLHMLGNHGPSYFRRYPAAFARFQPACRSDDLRSCSREEIVNAYDNALLYTDHVLAS
jgi:lipid A ethanolaminephosphotransferase